MAITTDWDETTPENAESVGAGALRIRAFKEAIRERLGIDHNFKEDETDDDDIGKHSQVELIEKEADPSNPTAGTVLYDKGGKVYMLKKTGDPIQLVDETEQDISGDKTFKGDVEFENIPTLPASDPTAANEATRKQYVDTVTILEKTDDYTLILTDIGKLVDMNKATAVTLTVPKNSAVAFPVGTIIAVRQKGAGTVTIAPVDGDVTIQAEYGLVLTGQHAVASVLKVAEDTWVAFGALEDAS